MQFRFCLKALFILFLPLLAFSDPWISGKEEFKVKKLEYLSTKNQFSIDTSAYPIPLALIRNPNDDMFNNMSLMNEYIDLRRGQGRKPFIDGPHFQLEVN